MQREKDPMPGAEEIRYLNGVEALAELPPLQIARDHADGHRTGAFCSGYRGSPLSGFDRTLTKRIKGVEDVVFQPGLNEELAATAVWGSQQVGLADPTDYDGVTGYWYAKAPGVDRATDALRHANHAGTAPRGGVLALLGDDHTCKSSTLPNWSDLIARHVGMPLLFPATVQEVIDYGLAGIGMSRFAGVWVGLKCLIDTMDASAPVIAGGTMPPPVTPNDVVLPAEGVSIRATDTPQEQEARLIRHRLPAAVSFARANGLNRVETRGRAPRLGIVTAGKSWLDTRQALAEIADEGAEAEVRIFKAGLVWPLDAQAIREFAQGLDAILVVEEKAAILEDQVRAALYNVPARPTVEGRRDRHDQELFPETGDLDALIIAAAIAARALPDGAAIPARLSARRAVPRLSTLPRRTPYFCAGCPHSTSTRVPDGSRALAGIGCHFMAQWMDRETGFYSQMGGEGTGWIGQAPFVGTDHVFANLGDGTYNHSGLLAIRAAAAAGVNITYKILFNDAVAMTGGQTNEGGLDVPAIVAQVWAEKARKVAVVTEDLARYRGVTLTPGTTLHHRDTLDTVQKEFRATQGMTVVVYDQGCATEKRRKRKRGLIETPRRRVFIDPDVCEGCGDCGVQSNCVAIRPLATPLGTKRTVDQSACNLDYSCLKGFCPSFVTVEVDPVATFAARAVPEANLPPPPASDTSIPHDLVIAGTGGTGVVSLGGVIGRAAGLAGRKVNVLDMIGLAQKGGPVVSQIRLAPEGTDVTAMRIVAGEADLLIGADALVTAGDDVLRLCGPATRACVEADVAPSADFVRDPDYELPADQIDRTLAARFGDNVARVPATALADALLGDTIGANAILLGHAVQTGALPLPPDTIEAAIRAVGTAVDLNLAAFRIGRRFAADPAATRATAGLYTPAPPLTVEDYATRLTAYQNAAYAARYRAALAPLDSAAVAADTRAALRATAAQALYRIMAYKDEYEVARLHAASDLPARIAAQTGGTTRLRYHLAPPMLPGTDSRGRPKKRAFGAWMTTGFRLLRHGKALRGTPFDPFGRTHERRAERDLIARYEGIIAALAATVTEEKADEAVALLRLGGEVRGYGPVKAAALARVENEWSARLPLFVDSA
jgi:indolepyruvate ferredoxin oxidoreductase